MPKENKNEKELSEEKFGKVSGGGNLRPGFKIPRKRGDVGLIGHPKTYYTDEEINSLLSKANSNMKKI